MIVSRSPDRPAGSLDSWGYPHISQCADCRGYADAAAAESSGLALVAAVLARHDAGHGYDPLALAREHFA